MRRARATSPALCLVALLAALVSAAAAAASPAPFLWHVDGRHATHYLVGSVHLLPAQADALPAALEDAYDQVDGVVFETDIGALATRATQLGFLAAGQSATPLKARIGAELYERTARRAKQLGMPMSLCERARAWWCALDLGIYLFRKAGFSEEYGLDGHFYGEALADGKALRWFEPTRSHLAVFTGMDTRLSHALLRAALEPDDSGLASPQAVYRAWRDNDVAAVAAFDRRFKRHLPALYARLIADRNRAWLPQLHELMNGSDAQMVVVGAAHLVGPDGLIGALQASGYRVEPGLAPAQRELHTAWRQPVRRGS